MSKFNNVILLSYLTNNTLLKTDDYEAFLETKKNVDALKIPTSS